MEDAQMKKIIAAAAALTASFGMIGSSGAFAESYNYDLDDIEGLYYANDDSTMLGDANGDGIVDGRDASDVLSEYAAVSSGKAVSFTDEQKTSADVNSDDSVDGRDASAILAYYAQISAGVKITVQKYMAGIKADSVISEMSLHDKVCQMFIVRPEELTNNADISVASQATADALKADPVVRMEEHIQVIEKIFLKSLPLKLQGLKEPVRDHDKLISVVL